MLNVHASLKEKFVTWPTSKPQNWFLLRLPDFSKVLRIDWLPTALSAAGMDSLLITPVSQVWLWRHRWSLQIWKVMPRSELGGGFKYFHPYLGKWSNMTNIFQRGWNHQLENCLAWDELTFSKSSWNFGLRPPYWGQCSTTFGPCGSDGSRQVLPWGNPGLLWQIGIDPVSEASFATLERYFRV